MQTQVSQQRNQLIRNAGIAMILARAAVIASLLIWVPSSLGSANRNPALAGPSVVPVQIGGARKAPVYPSHGPSARPIRPTCAEFGRIASAPITKTTGESGVIVGCGSGNNLAGGNRSGERADVATFLEWHVQARNFDRYAYQTILSGLSPSEDTEDRPR